MATLIWALNATTRTKKEALDLLDTALRTFAAVGDAPEARVTYLRRFKARKALTSDEEQGAERLIYSRVFDPAEHERSANVVDGLLAALEDKHLAVGLAVAAKATAAAPFKKKEREEAIAANSDPHGVA
eukprot:jgi/Tetstr1/443724/TSEL_031714.t1